MNVDMIRIHIVDDDADDRLLIKEALEEIHFKNDVEFSVDGQDLMDFLYHKGKYADSDSRLPDIILLDLNMPRKDGRQVLKELRDDPSLRHIPVVVLTTSQAEEDVLASYDLGTNSFIVKPLTFEKMVEAIAKLTDYWFGIVRLPNRH